MFGVLHVPLAEGFGEPREDLERLTDVRACAHVGPRGVTNERFHVPLFFAWLLAINFARDRSRHGRCVRGLAVLHTEELEHLESLRGLSHGQPSLSPVEVVEYAKVLLERFFRYVSRFSFCANIFSFIIITSTVVSIFTLFIKLMTFRRKN